MQFAVSAAALLAFASSVFAQNPNFDSVYKPASGEEIKAGTTYEIQWTAPAEFQDDTIVIRLIGGATQGGQVPLLDVASGVKNSDQKYEWSIPANIGGQKFYGLTFTSQQNPEDWQYSNPFVILAAEGAATTSSSAYAAPTASASSTTTITTSAGIATVTLSRASSSIPASSSVPANSTSSEVPEPTTSVVVKPTTKVVAPSTTLSPVTSSRVPAVVSESSAIPSPSVIPGENAGGRFQVGITALVGGLVAAFLL